MSDAHRYFQAHAVEAVRRVRSMPAGKSKLKQRSVARIYHLLAREAACAPDLHHLEDFHKLKRLERAIN
jgi:hypothetical protein